MSIDHAVTTSAATAWREELAAHLEAQAQLPRPEALRWAHALPAGYAGVRTCQEAAADVELLLQRAPSARLARRGTSTIHLASHGRWSLSQVIAVLDRLGVEVLSHAEWQVDAPDGQRHRLDDFTVDSGAVAAQAGPHLVEALVAVLAGEVDDDGFNKLVLAAGLTWRQVLWVRCWYRYLRQTGLPLGLHYVEAALARQPEALRALVDLFSARFDPLLVERPEAEQQALASAVAAVGAVSDRDDARILRAGLTLVRACLRTSAFLRDAEGRPLPRLSLKVDPAQLDWAPQPRPHREVFVHAPEVEGIHLRATAVSRGGLRWSDRPEDLRTEVLGLMKAQQVKNAGIVPGGAKGGFVLRRVQGDPASTSRTAYGQFIRGLLDVTDNIVEGVVQRSCDLVAHDGDDPYLVVAADKGTATFSDLANSIAAEYGFWLGDAFASGGSVGFDHKQLGITARGAWQSLLRHLGEQGVDAEQDPVTVIGIGDMSGDVFGNGMLLSRQLRLLAAFDHRHVFIDPQPDPEASWRERARLAALPRSSWADYDRAVLSPGGGVFPRHGGPVQLSEEARLALGLEERVLDPDELVRAVLRAPVDVLFNGGVGTYVKASTESHADAGDAARDQLRVDAAALRARVVVEGGNLGLTQRARVEFARAGGRINTDFLDNSAGVSTSDREVNIKIYLDAQVAAGELSRADRDQRLRDVVDDVTAAVLADSAAQARAVSVAEQEAPALLDRHRQLIRVLQRQGRLDPAVEHLPDETELDRRRSVREGLTRPELALLLAYSKDVVRDDLLRSGAIDDPDLAVLGEDYLPAALRSSDTEAFRRHPLHREIAATVVANQMVNRVGSSFIDRLEELTARTTPDVVRAYVVVSAALGLDGLWRQVEELDTAQHATAQLTLLIELRRILASECLWLLRSADHPLDVAAQAERLGAAARSILTGPGIHYPAAVQQQVDRHAERLQEAGAPEGLARAVAALSAPYPVLATARAAGLLGVAPSRTALVHLLLGDQLGWSDLLDQAAPRASDDHARHVAMAAVRLTVEEHAQSLVRQYLADHGDAGTDDADSVAAWLDARSDAVQRYRATLDTVRSASSSDLALLVAAAHQLSNVRAPARAW